MHLCVLVQKKQGSRSWMRWDWTQASTTCWPWSVSTKPKLKAALWVNIATLRYKIWHLYVCHINSVQTHMDSHTMAQHGKFYVQHMLSFTQVPVQADRHRLMWSFWTGICFVFFLETSNVNKQIEPNIVLTDWTL